MQNRQRDEQNDHLSLSLKTLDKRIDRAVARISELRRDQRFLAGRNTRADKTALPQKS